MTTATAATASPGIAMNAAHGVGQTDHSDDRFVSIPEACLEVVGYAPSRPTLSRWTASGVRGSPPLPTILVGGRRRIRISDFREWLAALK